jgi:hypothetical protein
MATDISCDQCGHSINTDSESMIEQFKKDHEHCVELDTVMGMIYGECFVGQPETGEQKRWFDEFARELVRAAAAAARKERDK